MRDPEEGVPVGDSQRLEGLHQALLDVLGNEAGDILEEVKCEPNFSEMPVDGTITVRKDGLGRRDQLK